MVVYVGNSKSVKIVERTQRTFTRRLFVSCNNSLQVPPYEERLKLFGLHKLSTRLNIIELTTLYKLSDNLMVGQKFYKFSNRTSFRFVIPSIKPHTFTDL